MVAQNLPTPSAPFIGRTDEVTEVGLLLAEPACQVLTLVGMGGSGKTRFALQVAKQQSQNFLDGVLFIPLAPLNSADPIIPAITNVMGLRFDLSEVLDQRLCAYLSDKQLLLIMGNFEHVLDGRELVADIVETAPRVKILATSREVLNLQEEWIGQVHELQVPDSQRTEFAENYSAIQLFMGRARRVQSISNWEMRHLM